MNYLEGLNDAQREAALHTTGPLLIVAGAGAGKTTTVTRRIAHLIASGVPSRAILALTFTNKAGQEMRERVHHTLQGQGGGIPLVATFHTLGVRLMREFHAELGVPRHFSIWDRDDSVRATKRILKSFGDEESVPRQVFGALSKAKGIGKTVSEYQSSTRSSFEQVVARTWDAYERTLREEGALDFEDLLVRTRNLLRDNDRIRALLNNRWTHITIDEYQDTNLVQYDIARLLAGAAQNLCVVGDVDQCIYSWRNADIGNLLQFEKTFAGTKTVLLEENYRSTRTIITAANAIIEKNIRRVPKKLFTNKETGDPLFLYGGGSELDEAYFIAQKTREILSKGVTPSEVAVLYRENFQSRALEDAFLRSGIPYRVLGTRFFERAEVKDALSYLRASLNPDNKADLGRIIGTPPRGIGKQTLEKIMDGKESELPTATQTKVAAFRGVLQQIRHAAVTLPVSEAVKFCIEASGLEKLHSEASEESRERLGNLRELVNLATRWDAETPEEGIEHLLEEAALQSEQDNLKKEVSAVSLMTVHASKGLEFDVVFITGLEQGLFPHEGYGGEERDEEEERRLFYVALTRARKQAFLTYAQGRMKFGERSTSYPSEFISDIDTRLIHDLSPRIAGFGGRRSLLDDDEDVIR